MISKWVAITGSNGYIGSVLAKHCKEKGYKVLGVDYTYGSTQGNIYYNKYPYVDVAIGCKISDMTFANMCLTYKIQEVYHLAASADVKQSQELPFHFYHNNIGETAQMLHNLQATEWTKRGGKIVYSSSAAVYKEKNTPVSEDDEKCSPNAYGDSKLISEQLFHKLFEYFKVPSVIFRYFNVAGARDDVGDRLNTSHIIPIMCKAAYDGTSFNLYGTDYSTPDGTAVRDYIDVNDVCRAHFAAVEHMEANPGVHTYNLGTRTGTSLMNLVRKFEDVVKIDLNYNVSDRRPGDPGYLVANPNKFVDETGFDYSSNLESMIQSSWNYYCKKREEKNGI